MMIFALNHDKRLQIYFYVKHLSENDFQKDIESLMMTYLQRYQLYKRKLPTGSII